MGSKDFKGEPGSPYIEILPQTNDVRIGLKASGHSVAVPWAGLSSLSWLLNQAAVSQKFQSAFNAAGAIIPLGFKSEDPDIWVVTGSNGEVVLRGPNVSRKQKRSPGGEECRMDNLSAIQLGHMARDMAVMQSELGEEFTAPKRRRVYTLDAASYVACTAPWPPEVHESFAKQVLRQMGISSPSVPEH